MATRKSLLLVLLLPAIVLLGGLLDRNAAAKEEPVAAPKAAEALEGLAGLVPADSELLIYMPSADGLQAKLKRVLGAIDPEMAEEVDVDMMLSQFAGPLLDLLDRSKPVAIAMKMTKEQGPVPTAVLPVTDVAQAKKRFVEGGQPEPKTSGAYVQMWMMPGAAPAGGSKLMQGIPAGDVVVRMDLASLIERNRADIDQMLEGMREQMKSGMDAQMPVPGAGKMMEGLEKVFVDVIDSAEAFDLTATVTGTNVHLKGFFTAKEGSPLADVSISGTTTGLAPLASALPGDYPMAMLFSMDMEKVMEVFEPFMDMAYEMYPEKLRDQMKTYMEAWKPLYAKMGDQHAFAMDMGDQGMTLVGVSTMKDAKGFIEDYKRIVTEQGQGLAEEMGVKFEFGQQAVAGHEVHTMHVTLDWDKLMAASGQSDQMTPEMSQMAKDTFKTMFGGDDMVYHMIPLDDRVVWTMGGGDDLLQKTLEAALGQLMPITAGGLPQAIRTAGGAPTFLFYMEARSLFAGAMKLAQKVRPPEARGDVPAVPEGDAVPLVVYGSKKGRQYMGGMSIDVGAAAKLVMEFLSPR